MLSIGQNSKIDRYKLESTLYNNGEVRLFISEDNLREDVKRLILDKKESNSKRRKDDIDRCLKELKEFYNRVTIGKNIKLTWNVGKSGSLNIYPKELDLKHFKNLDVDYLSYINTKNNNLVLLDYSDLGNAISYYAVYRDLGYDNQNVEGWLKNYGIIGIYDYNDIKNKLSFLEEGYELGKKLKVLESSYCCLDSGKVITYFGNELETNDYIDIIHYDCVYTMTLIYLELLLNCRKEGIGIKLCSLRDNGIYISLNKEEDFNIIKEKIEMNVVFKFFGRNFLFTPKIEKIEKGNNKWIV